jgi:predicted ATPase
MITKIEIDGFKSFAKFELALPPFAVILGPNASGKSNLFDAFKLLSLLAGGDVRSALRGLRGEPIEQFRKLPDGQTASRISLAAELLLPPAVRDEYGQTISLTCTRVRYEVTIERRDRGGVERYFVVTERLNPIRRAEDHWTPHGRQPSAGFRSKHCRYSTRKTAFLDTAADGKTFHIHQDNRQGKIRHVPAVEAEQTILAATTLAQDFPHLYAVRRAFAELRFLQLDPTAERRPAPLDSPDRLEPSGRNLAAVLHGVVQETRSEDRPEGAMPDIVADLARLVPGVTNLHVERDEERREYRLSMTMRDGQTFESGVLSDGTLRILALLTLLHDPRERGTICFEEPENGVHPTRLEELMRLLQEQSTDPQAGEVEEDEPLLQILCNTHSPVAARAIKGSLFLAEMATVVDPEVRTTQRRTRIESYEVHDDLFSEPARRRLARRQIDQFLGQLASGELAA